MVLHMTQTNKMTNNLKLVAFLLLSIVIYGCSTRVGDLNIVSTKEIDLSKGFSLDASHAKRYLGEDCSFFIHPDIPLFGFPNLETAVDRALLKGKGNVMIDEVTKVSKIWIIIGTIECISAEGAVLSAPYKTFP